MTAVVGAAFAAPAGCANDALLTAANAEPSSSDAMDASAAVDGGPGPSGRDASRLTDAASSSHDAGNPADGPTAVDSGRAASCQGATPPTAGQLIWLRAGTGFTDDGQGNVSAWADQVGGAAAQAPSPAQRPTYAMLNGKPVLHFGWDQNPSDNDPDNQQAALERAVPINGLTAMTLVFVNATDVLWKDQPTEWCHYAACDGDPSTQVPGMRRISETGCSGTYQHVLWWNGAPNPSMPGSALDWSGVFLSPKQEGIGFRFGNLVETYSPSCCDIPSDPAVEWHRPQSIGAGWTETIAVHDNLTNTLYSDGVVAESLPAPGGKDPKVYADDTLDIGNGFGWVDTHNHGGYVAEVIVYARALSTAEIAQVVHYLDCSLFPERLPGGAGADP